MDIIKFDIEGKEYECPTWINIENYVKVYKIKDIFSDEYFSAKFLNILTGAPVEELLEADYQKIKWLSNYCMSLFPKDKQAFVDKFEIDGKWYGFIPSWRKLSFAEYVDLDTLITKKNPEVLDYIHIITAIMYRPIIGDHTKSKFEIEKYNQGSLHDRAELFKKKLNINVFIGAQFFFIQFVKKFSELTQTSSTMTLTEKIRIMWKMRKMRKLLLKKDSDGMLLSTELVPTILQSMIRSSKKPWWKF